MCTNQCIVAPPVMRSIRALLAGMLILAASAPAGWAQVIYSAHVDLENAKITVTGGSLDTVGVFTLGGVTVSTANVTASTLDIPFNADVANAVQWPGSYRLVADGSVFISVYFGAAVEDPGAPPPPPPPPAGPDCPCIAGWDASGIPQDGLTLCWYDYSGPQQWIAGQRDQWFISAAFDPYNIYFDPVDPGNSVSYCALNDGTDWTVAEPVVNQDQFDDCNHWLWLRVCL